MFMIVDFQHHFTPPELMEARGSGGPVLLYDASGAPRSTAGPLLCDLDEHICMMDAAGIGAAVLSSPAGMCADLAPSRIVNDKARDAERNYPGRFIGTAHVHPLGGPEAYRELERCAHELGFPGVIITSEFNGLYVDAPEMEPFWGQAERLGLYVFIHPPLIHNFPQQYDAYDLGRSVGREISLISATIRLINSGVLDRHPSLVIQMSHLGGGIGAMMSRIRSYQDREFWGTAGHPRHGMKPEKDFDYYIRQRIVFDVAGFCGGITSVQAGLLEIPASHMVFGTDYPQEIRTREDVRDYVSQIRKLGKDGQRILSGNNGLLLKT
jgi:predicted TIM-barrel fold metal-dependent hydrolase